MHTSRNNAQESSDGGKEATQTAKVVKKLRFAEDVQYEPHTSRAESDTETSNGIEWLWNSLVSWLSDDYAHDVTNKRAVLVSPFLNKLWTANLRVQQIGLFSQPKSSNGNASVAKNARTFNSSLQPANVYINRRTFDNYMYISAQKQTNESVTTSFLANLKFLPSPSQKEQQIKKAMEKSSQKHQQHTKSGEPSTLETVTSSEICCHSSNIVGPKVIVRVIVLEQHELSEVCEVCKLCMLLTVSVLSLCSYAIHAHFGKFLGN